MGIRMFSGSRRKVSGRAGMSSGSVMRPHNCMSPGCTRRGEPERGYNSIVTRPHHCMSPGCTRRGEMENVSSWTSIPSKLPAAPVGPNSPKYAPDPDPFRFTILKSFSDGGLTLAKVNYHGCTNYEGQKILLFRNDIGNIVARDSLDPHFLENDENGLLARFVPTEEGWQIGLACMNSIISSR